MEFKVKLLHENARLPERQHSTDVGLDLYIADIQIVEDVDHIMNYGWHEVESNYPTLADLSVDLEYRKPLYVKIDFGIAIQPPEGYYFELVPRSSIHKYKLAMANSIGIIDPAYRGSICMMAYSTYGNMVCRTREQLVKDALPKVGERFGQLILRKIHYAEPVEVDDLTDTERGEGGFGSTGV